MLNNTPGISLESVFQFTPQDLNANRSGKLSPRQANLHRALSGSGGMWGIAIMFVVLVIVGIIVLAFVSPALSVNSVGADPSQAALLAGLVGVLVIIFAVFFLFALPGARRSRGGRVEALTGIVQIKKIPAPGGGFIPRLHINGVEFTVPPRATQIIQDGQPYRVYFQNHNGHAQWILSVEALNPGARPVPPPQTQNPADVWNCSSCGAQASGPMCSTCGAPRPAETPAVATVPINTPSGWQTPVPPQPASMPLAFGAPQAGSMPVTPGWQNPAPGLNAYGQPLHPQPRDVFLVQRSNQMYLPQGRRRGGRLFQVFAWVFLLLIFAGASALGVYYVYREITVRQQLGTSGVSIQATVSEKIFRRTANRNGRYSTSYYLRYTFVAANGASQSREEEISLDEYNRVTEGGTVQVCYLPSDPTVSRLCGADLSVTSLQSGTLLLIVSAGFTVILLLGAITSAREWWRRTHMKLVYGSVIDFQEISRSKFALLYQYQTLDGQTVQETYTGNRRNIRRNNQPVVGTPIAVRVNGRRYKIL